MITLLAALGALSVMSIALRRQGDWTRAVLGLGPAAGFFWVLSRRLPAAGLETNVDWIPSLGISLALRMDGLAQLFSLLILGVGAAVVVYAAFYMHSHPFVGRFFALLFAFMASMLGLVLADDAITLFVFWELTSLTSFLLIGFDHQHESARKAARKALVVTGAGGLCLLAGFLVLNAQYDTFRISQWLAEPKSPSHAALVLILLAAFTKSAQFPFHFWLPAAMAGPTPVSAYLHSATMVKGGVYLLARMSPLLAEHPAWGTTLLIVGCVTMVSAAFAALRFDDLKTLLAYTTLMALGLFVALLGTGNEDAGRAVLVYLVVHASYKGSLFMAAGAIDHGTGTRNRSELGGLRRALPLTTVAVLLACASMAGLPPFLGFVGKELAYEATLHGACAPWLWMGCFVLANAALLAGAVLLIRPHFGAESRDAHEERGLALPALVVAALGLPLGVVPGLLDPLVSSAARAITPGAAPAHLALWHGFSPAFVATLLTYGLGVGFAVLGDKLWATPVTRFTLALYHQGTGRAFERLLVLAHRVARVVTRIVYPRVMGTAIGQLAAALALVITVSVAASWTGSWPAVADLRVHELVLAAVLAGSAWGAALTRRAVTAFMSAGISGFTLALLYLLFSAPDVAMTQLAVETLTVFLFVLTLIHMPRELEDERPRGRAIFEAVVASITGAATTAVVLMLLSTPFESEASRWYLENSYLEAHGRNVVNVILVDFRAFDTLGEITVLALAGIGVWALLLPRTDTQTRGPTSDENQGTAG